MTLTPIADLTGPAGALANAKMVCITDPEYGCDPLGIADSSVGFNAARAVLEAQGGGIMIAPPGTYKFDLEGHLPDFTEEESPSSINRPFTILGAGKHATKFIIGTANFDTPQQPRYLLGHPSWGGISPRGQNSFLNILGVELLGPGWGLEDGNAAMDYNIPVLALSNVYKGVFDIHVEGCPAGPAVSNWSHSTNGSQGNEFKITTFKGEWDTIGGYVVVKQEAVRRRSVRYLIDNNGGVANNGKANDNLVGRCHVYNPLIGVVDNRGHGYKTVTTTGSPAGGTFTLMFDGEETATIAFDASAATLQTALEGLPNVEPGDFVVTKSSGVWSVYFIGQIRHFRWSGTITAGDNNLTGGSSPAVVVAYPDNGGGTDNLRVLDNFFAARQTMEIEEGEFEGTPTNTVMKLRTTLDSGTPTFDEDADWTHCVLRAYNPTTLKWESKWIDSFNVSTRVATLDSALTFVPSAGDLYYIQYSDARARLDDGWSAKVVTHAVMWSSRDYDMRMGDNRCEGIVEIVASSGLDSEWGIESNYDVRLQWQYTVVTKSEHCRRTDGTEWRPRTWLSMRPGGDTSVPAAAQLRSLMFGTPEDENASSGATRPVLNDTGGTLVNGNVVAVKATDRTKVIDAQGPTSPLQHAVVWNDGLSSWEDGERLSIITHGMAPIMVDCTSVAVVAGDYILPSATTPYGVPVSPGHATPGHVAHAIGRALFDMASGSGVINVWCKIIDTEIAPGPLFALKPTDTTVNNTTTKTASSTLKLALLANHTYTFEAYIVYDSSAVADFGAGWLIPSGAAISWSAMALVATASGVSGSIRMEHLTGLNASSIGGAGAGVLAVAHMKGTIVVAGTAGDLQFNWAQGTAEATNTILKAGSWMRAVLVA
jgi:hypothetical protein